MTKVIRNQKSRLPGSTVLREPLDGPHFLSPHPGPLPWGEGESSAVFGPSPRRSLPVQCAQNTVLGGGCSLSPGERVRVRGNDGSTVTDCRISKGRLNTVSGFVILPLFCI